MELINNLELKSIIDFIHTQGFYYVLYTYFLLLVLLTEIITLFYLNYHLVKLGKDIYIDKLDNNPLLIDLKKKYKVLLERQYDLVNTRRFIDSYFSRYSKIKVFLINIIENSGFFFLMLGLVGAFIILLSAIISINFQGLAGFQELYDRLSEVISNLQPAAFSLILGIISAIIINIFLKLFDLNNRYDKIKLRLENYLDNNLKYKYNREFKQLKLFEQLIQNLNNNFMGLEDVIEDTISDSLSEINETINKNLSGDKQNTVNKELADREIASTEDLKDNS